MFSYVQLLRPSTRNRNPKLVRNVAMSATTLTCQTAELGSVKRLPQELELASEPGQALIIQSAMVRLLLANNSEPVGDANPDIFSGVRTLSYPVPPTLLLASVHQPLVS